jgi:hypothetical protein
LIKNLCNSSKTEGIRKNAERPQERGLNLTAGKIRNQVDDVLKSDSRIALYQN